MLKRVLDSDEVEQGMIWSLNGKILHVRPLVPSGRFHVNYLIKANGFSADRAAMVPVTTELKEQCWFWFTMLRVCTGRSSLPDPLESMPPWCTEVYTDATEGSTNKSGLGVEIRSKIAKWCYAACYCI